MSEQLESGPSIQLMMFRFGLTVSKTNPELYEKIIAMPLSEVSELINKMYDVEITKGMDIRMLGPIIDVMLAASKDSN